MADQYLFNGCFVLVTCRCIKVCKEARARSAMQPHPNRTILCRLQSNHVHVAVVRNIAGFENDGFQTLCLKRCLFDKTSYSSNASAYFIWSEMVNKLAPRDATPYLNGHHGGPHQIRARTPHVSDIYIYIYSLLCWHVPTHETTCHS